MVVAGQHQHTAMLGNAGRVAMLEYVTTAVDPGPLAVPHGEHAVVARAREQVGLLAAPYRRRAQLFVDAGLEVDVVFLQVIARIPQALVQTAQRRAAIAGDEAGGIESEGGVTLLLQHGQAGQRLGAGQVEVTSSEAVFVIQADFGQ
jgi:hypothetical protein